MDPVSSSILGALLSYLVSFAANESSAAIHQARRKRLREHLANEQALHTQLANAKNLRDRLSQAATEVARNRAQLGVTPEEEPLFDLLLDEPFQADLGDWLMAGGIEEGRHCRQKLVVRMAQALERAGAAPQRVEFLEGEYFELIEAEVFSNPTLAHWRHQLSLEYLREQVAFLRQKAEEAAGVYSDDRQAEALDRYCDLALKTWDIIDLSNLPEGDIHIATQAILLRELYVPLRLDVEPRLRHGPGRELFAVESTRERRRLWEAGRLASAEGPNEAKHRRRRLRRVPVGERLRESRRLVILADPGGGKTTMLRWMATAYLLRHREDAAFEQLPDVQTLPHEAWIPVLVRCRDLGEQDLSRSFADMVIQHFRKSELEPDDASVMTAVVMDRLAKGEALILVDGLDEIASSRVRTLCCQELERTAARYPEAPIVVTSRIVGYREMPYRMRSGFEHGVIADLKREDKDQFAARWVEVTEQHRPTQERVRRTDELIEALHSSDRIERLAGNPMLLTTLALVKRKVGKLPSRRIDLYREAVTVLLNWNPASYEQIEEREAIPQLEYVAYEMCHRGVQRLSEDDVLDLLNQVRRRYPNVYAIHERTPAEFVRLLEARSSILIQSGALSSQGVYEFRHLTLQEYLAARALLDGRYADRDKSKTLAEQIAPLAQPAKVRKRRTRAGLQERVDVSESWREVLRLCVAACPDDDVDATLLAILMPLEDEKGNRAARPRAALAALCLADEPNVSQQTAAKILRALAEQVRDADALGKQTRTVLGAAAQELIATRWRSLLEESLIEEFRRRKSKRRWAPGKLWGQLGASRALPKSSEIEKWLAAHVSRIRSQDANQAISSAIAIVTCAERKRVGGMSEAADALLEMLKHDRASRDAGARALAWLSGWFDCGGGDWWRPTRDQVEILLAELGSTPVDEASTRESFLYLLGNSGDSRAVDAILKCLGDANKSVRRAALRVLAKIDDVRAVEAMLTSLTDKTPTMRRIAIRGLVRFGDRNALGAVRPLLNDRNTKVRRNALAALVQTLEETDQQLLSQSVNGLAPWLDPREPIHEARVQQAAQKLELPAQEIRQRYETLAREFGIKLTWVPEEW